MAEYGFTYKDLEVWQLASRVTIKVIKEFETCKNFSFKDQVTRSALSIPANIAEGFGRKSSKEFLQFLSYARGSADETGSHLYIGSEVKYVSKEFYTEVDEELFRITKMLNSLSAAERRKPKKNF